MTKKKASVRVVVALVCLLVPMAARAQVTVSGNLKDAGVANITGSNTFARFTLVGYGSNIPRVSGTNVIAVPSKDFHPDASGNISGSIQGNNTISVGSNPAGGTWYQVCIYNQGQLFRCDNFTITASPFNLNSATPNTTNPTVPAPTGDTTYLRLDAGNVPVTGNLSISGTEDDAGGSHTGTETFTGAGSQSGTETFRNINTTVYGAGYGMACDGVTDDTTALTTAIAAGGKNAHIILPASLNPCLIKVESGTISVYDGSWISGAGKFGTTLKRANGGSANNNIFTVAPGGVFGTVGNVLFTDFTIDGNYANETGGGSIIAGTSPLSNTTILRMRLINTWFHGINLGLGTGNNADISIADSDFENNGLRAGCVGVGICFDINVQTPLRVRATRNRSDGAQNFWTSSGHNGAGLVTISENTVNTCLGFGVALGGGGTNPGPAAISDNTFNCPASSINTIDIALWQDVRVENNTITGPTNNAAPTAGIADAPPANRVQVIGNHIIGNNNLPACISLGGSDLLIANNYCTTAWGSGIVVAVGSATQAKNIVISGNTTKNGGHLGAGVGGIELFLAPSGVNSVTMSNKGSGYTSVPTVTFTGGGGTGASGTAVLGGVGGQQVMSVTMTNTGAGYTSAPTVGFTGGGGANAAGTAVLVAALSSVIIKGNRSFDDQASPTQNYGIVLARTGQTTGFSNITIEGNDLRGNITTGILNNLSGATGMQIANNPGAEAQVAGAVTFPTLVTGGVACTNAEIALSAGWQSTGAATVTAAAGNGQTCSWTITTGTTTAANPTVTDTLTNALPNATTVCELNIHGGTHTAAAGEGFQQTTLSATAPIFTFNGTPTAGGTTYFVTRRCGP
jgi:hypothetical protein